MFQPERCSGHGADKTLSEPDISLAGAIGIHFDFSRGSETKKERTKK